MSTDNREWTVFCELRDGWWNVVEYPNDFHPKGEKFFLVEKSAYEQACKERNGARALANMQSSHSTVVAALDDMIRERDEWKAKYDELVFYMPKVPTEPYEKQLARECAEWKKRAKGAIVEGRRLAKEAMSSREIHLASERDELLQQRADMLAEIELLKSQCRK